MKYEATFIELAAIFSDIAKAEIKIAAYMEAEKDYSAGSENYYTTNNPGDMLTAYDAREKCEAAVKRVFSKLTRALELDKNNYEDKIILGQANRFRNNPYGFLYAVKRRALELAKQIDIYAK